MCAVLRGSSGITELELDENMIGDLGACALAEVLTSSSRMKRLLLGRNHIGESGVQALANALSGCQCLLEYYGGAVWLLCTTQMLPSALVLRGEGAFHALYLQ